jgi:hypothetical protein
MYQDSAGTTAAALESPVGLQLDLSQGLALGSELVTPAANSNFSSDTGFWTKETGWAIGGGFATATNAANAFAIYKNFFLTASVLYSVTFTISSISAGAIRIYASGNISASFSSVGTYTVQILNGTATNTFQIQAAGTTTASITNVSVKQVTGNHRFQTTSANRPILSARYNLLQKTEQFNDAAWTKAQATITSNTIVAPDGTLTADKLVEDTAASAFHYALQSAGSSGIVYTTSCYIKQGGRAWALIGQSGGTSGAYFDLQNGVTGAVSVGFTSSIASAGDGWYKCSVTMPSPTTAIFIASAIGNNQAQYTGNGTDGIYVWGADLRPANQATGLIPTYQRVDTSSVYDTVGFPQYIKYDGLNSSLSTASIDFTATAQMSVFSGVRKLVDGVYPTIFEFSANSDTNNGSFTLVGSRSTSLLNYFYQSRGTSSASTISSSYVAPITNVVTGLSNITAPSVTLRVNGSDIQTSTATQGTGNYGNYSLYFGRRNNASFPFNGQEYQTIIVGKTLTATEIANTETYVNSKTLAY